MLNFVEMFKVVDISSMVISVYMALWYHAIWKYKSKRNWEI